LKAACEYKHACKLSIGLNNIQAGGVNVAAAF